MANLDQVVLKPLITEKSTFLGDKYNKYIFYVALNANKYQIKSSIESLYDVKVLEVQTSVRPGRVKRAGAHMKKTTNSKKAYVKLAEGQKIEFFKSV